MSAKKTVKPLVSVIKSSNSISRALIKTPEISNQNYGVCFQLYEERFQHITLKKLKPEELKSFNQLILEVIKCKTEAEFSQFNRGKNNCGKKSKLNSHLLKNELIHIGKARTTFRLHGVILDKIFKIISIDPKHEEHNS